MNWPDSITTFWREWKKSDYDDWENDVKACLYGDKDSLHIIVFLWPPDPTIHPRRGDEFSANLYLGDELPLVTTPDSFPSINMALEMMVREARILHEILSPLLGQRHRRQGEAL